MSYTNFESSREIEKKRQEIREARQSVLEKVCKINGDFSSERRKTRLNFPHTKHTRPNGTSIRTYKPLLLLPENEQDSGWNVLCLARGNRTASLQKRLKPKQVITVTTMYTSRSHLVRCHGGKRCRSQSSFEVPQR